MFPPSSQALFGSKISLGATNGNDRTSYRLLQKGREIPRERSHINPFYSFRQKRYVEGDNIDGGSRKDGRNQRTISASLFDTPEDTSHNTGIQLSSPRRGTTTRVVVWANWNWEKPEDLERLSRSLCEACQQMVGRLRRSRYGSDRRMGTEERVHGVEVEDLGRSLSISSGDQGWYDPEDPAEEDYRDI